MRRTRPQTDTSIQAELPRLLIACEDEELRAQLRSSLGPVCSMEEADDGRFALAQAVTSMPNVIVISERLQGFDGLTLCRLLRRDRKLKMARIAVIGSEQDDFVCRARVAGADRVLSATAALPLVRAEIEQLLSEPAADAWGSPPPERPAGRRRSDPPRTSVTDHPPLRPPTLVCPRCDSGLIYVSSFLGGLETVEQWDTFKCSRGCGTFQYRHRNRSLRPRDTQ